MAPELTWLEPDRVFAGCHERGFSLRTATDRIPGVCWRPTSDAAASRALMLLGHGGSGHKRSDRVVGLARRLARELGVVSVAIDGPYHGDRLTAPLSIEAYQARIVQQGIGTVTDRMVADWRAVIAALTADGLVDGDWIGYHGMSMGARFGLPLAGVLGEGLRCLVIGKFGLEQHPDIDARMLDRELIMHAARSVRGPTLFHLPWDDEVFPRRGQLELFDCLAPTSKRLLGCAGGHGDTPADAVDAWIAFIARQLG